jgi:hypothetical protein
MSALDETLSERARDRVSVFPSFESWKGNKIVASDCRVCKIPGSVCTQKQAGRVAGAAFAAELKWCF